MNVPPEKDKESSYLKLAMGHTWQLGLPPFALTSTIKPAQIHLSVSTKGEVAPTAKHSHFVPTDVEGIS